MQNSMVVFTFSVLDQKNTSWANFVQRFKIACSKWSLIQSLIRICGIQWWCPFYLFWSRNTLFGLPFLCKFGPKNQNGQFELKIGTNTISNMKNLIVRFIFPVLDRKYHFFWASLKNLCWSCNLESRLIRMCRIQCWFSFCLDRKYPFWVDLVQKFKRVNLRQTLVLFKIC